MPVHSPTPVDVAIIGAGPAGSVAASLLHARGHRVRVLERQHFPRFSIGESLLPQCMEFLEEANLLKAVQANVQDHHFRFKNGAAFVRGEQRSTFDFTQKFSPGWGTTFQVQRAPFDDVLAREIERQGVPISWGHEITRVDISVAGARLQVRSESGDTYMQEAGFVLDASGFGRVLPRLLDLDRPSGFPLRTSLFTHVEDRIDSGSFDRDKILITVHHQHKDVWFWLIPFANGRSSVGVVAEDGFFTHRTADLDARLKEIIASDPGLGQLLGNARFDTPAREIRGYASDVSRLWGERFALLGNAGEFLDPVFSSGVTIAMKSASLAARTLDRQLRGETVDWQKSYAQPLQAGINTFRVFVEAWYDGRFQDIIFAARQSKEVRAMISSILAGYAWDTNNPYVRDSERRLNTLYELCRMN
ncbi:NAD(P)/FAD-dependent oxidoreductase [Pseudomaricurvus alkylphenolicus]|uniref:NAD(P)/FAD-dependent oxidoreductase n=1 Tax=Pseudomaricurvus alkylphenolicus TaxID=1306991 RepID=UPI00141EAD88|nr:NAD(P)/FAD-dependent oxidoreductase [Pseudomaricurvus alkylphenolicus]NIB44234.1 NAD(P)/FAD-dependent oxidoreductase [Pseudomaricurvus alkylphenolicus]